MGERHRAISPGVTNAEYDGLLHKRHEAASIYSRALWQRVIAARDKFRNRVQPPRARDAIALREEMYDAEIHLDLLEKLGFDFSTERERIDAHARAWLARERYEIAEEKFQDHQRQARADRRAGIVRT